MESEKHLSQWEKQQSRDVRFSIYNSRVSLLLATFKIKLGEGLLLSGLLCSSRPVSLFTFAPGVDSRDLKFGIRIG